jgi:hypothetical protein
LASPKSPVKGTYHRDLDNEGTLVTHRTNALRWQVAMVAMSIAVAWSGVLDDEDKPDPDMAGRPEQSSPAQNQGREHGDGSREVKIVFDKQ